MKEKEELRITLPTAPSDGLREMVESSEWAKMEGLLYEIAWVPDPITRIKQKAVKVTCTGCGMHAYYGYVPASSGNQTVYGFWNENMKTIRDGDKTTCECCGAQATAVRKGGIRGLSRVIAYEWPSELRQVDGKACFLGFRVQNEVMKNGTKRISYDPWEGYVLSGGKVTRFSGHMPNMGREEITFGCYEKRMQYRDDWQESARVYVPEGILTGTEAENSRWDKYCQNGHCYPVSYIKQWTKLPVLEAIVETGGARLVTDAIEAQRDDSHYYYAQISSRPIPGISRKERKPSAALGLTKEEYKVALRKKWPMALVRLTAKAKKDGVRITEEDADLIMREGDKYTGELYDMNPKEFLRALRYLVKQKQKTKRKDLINAHYYRDYCNMAEKNGEDLDEVRYPRNLIAAHDREATRTQERIDTANKAEFDERAKKLLPLIWEKDGLLIRPALSEAELRAEGKSLSHCVGGYAEKMRRSETAILFIRRSESPNASYYTLELDERMREVKQNRGNHNCARTPEVEAFEAAWLEHVRKDLIRDKDGTWKEKKHERRDDESAA